MDAFYQELGQRIRHERKALGFTQEDICAVTGIKRPTLVNIETGVGHVRVHVLARLAWALGLDIQCLVPVTNFEESMDKAS